MKFSIKVSKLTAEQAAEQDRLRAEGARLSGNARLSLTGGDLAQLGRQGWTSDQIDQLLTAWPDASKLSVSMLISLASAMNQKLHVRDVEEVIDWTRALYEQGRGGFIELRRVVRDELKRLRREQRQRVSVIKLVQQYEDAAGSREAALNAVRAGLTVDQARR